MGQTTDQIENQIETTRDDLKSNLRELETRVKSAADWRRYFAEHTGTMVAAAFGGGVLLAAMLGGRSNRTSAGQLGGSAAAAHQWNKGTKHEVLENLDSIKSALVGTATTKFKSILGEMVPGFSEHLAKSEADRGRESTH
ncbi:MAG TPA: hypothetical protein VJS12_08770 [Steroidobacteraceae bacterium]|nr:hypothetical protein [Steroidobacteraceae bacterium]